MTLVVVTRDVRAEVAEARRWYESRREGLGRKFLDRVTEAIETIRRQPQSHFRVEGRDARLCLVRGFPYVVLYRVEPRRVVVFAVFTPTAIRIRGRSRPVWSRRVGFC